MLVVEAAASMTSMSDAAAPLPPLPIPTVTLPPAPPLAIARRSSVHRAGRRGDAAHKANDPDAARAAVVVGATGVDHTSCGADGLRGEIHDGARASGVDRRDAVPPGAAEKPPELPPPLAIVLMVKALGPL